MSEYILVIFEFFFLFPTIKTIIMTGIVVQQSRDREIGERGRKYLKIVFPGDLIRFVRVLSSPLKINDLHLSTSLTVNGRSWKCLWSKPVDAFIYPRETLDFPGRHTIDFSSIFLLISPGDYLRFSLSSRPRARVLPSTRIFYKIVANFIVA